LGLPEELKSGRDGNPPTTEDDSHFTIKYEITHIPGTIDGSPPARRHLQTPDRWRACRELACGEPVEPVERAGPERRRHPTFPAAGYVPVTFPAPFLSTCRQKTSIIRAPAT
jgi:hypothetical protein